MSHEDPIGDTPHHFSLGWTMMMGGRVSTTTIPTCCSRCFKACTSASTSRRSCARAWRPQKPCCEVKLPKNIWRNGGMFSFCYFFCITLHFFRYLLIIFVHCLYFWSSFLYFVMKYKKDASVACYTAHVVLMHWLPESQKGPPLLKHCFPFSKYRPFQPVTIPISTNRWMALGCIDPTRYQGATALKRVIFKKKYLPASDHHLRGL